MTLKTTLMQLVGLRKLHAEGFISLNTLHHVTSALCELLLQKKHDKIEFKAVK
jgi:hypothetical protein